MQIDKKGLVVGDSFNGADMLRPGQPGTITRSFNGAAKMKPAQGPVGQTHQPQPSASTEKPPSNPASQTKPTSK